ncbi:MAG: MoaD/ThiS family protein, partial [Rhodospirillaceae bacterium]
LSQYTGGVTEAEVEAATIRQVFRELGAQFPALAPHLADGIAVAIDGQIYQDALFEPIPEGAEVVLIPKIGGGRPRR